MKGKHIGPLIVLVLTCGPAAARAEAPRSRMVVSTAAVVLRIGDGAQRCPDEAYLRREVAAELGYDPFATGAVGAPAGRFSVVIARAPGGLTATAEYADVAGTTRWTRTYHDRTTTRAACESVLKGVALQIVTELTRFEDEPPPAPAPPDVPVAPPLPAALPPPPAPGLPPPPSSRPLLGRGAILRFEVGLAAFGTVGAGPRVTGGGALHAGLVISRPGAERTHWLLAVEGRADGPSMDALGTETQLFMGSLVACGARDLLSAHGIGVGVEGCAVGAVGVLRVSDRSFDGYVSRSASYAAAGARVGLEAWIADVVVRPEIEVLPTLTTAPVSLQGHGVSVGGFTGSAGVAAAFVF
jgi:hypothetical protein